MRTTLVYSELRLQAFLRELRGLYNLEFPYNDAKEAVKLLDQTFTQHLAQHPLATTDEISRQLSRSCLAAMCRYLPHLGLILRSTNVRNAFEVTGPLLRLASDLLEPGWTEGTRKTRLVLSSEWEYSPLIYAEAPALPNFVFIGLPASESSNPLLLPLAGHEFGHRVWAQRGFESRVKQKFFAVLKQSLSKHWNEFKKLWPANSVSPELDEIETDLIAMASLRPSYLWLRRQCEESFCDFLGLRIFGKAFLYAFSYLLSPGTPGERDPTYPDLPVRAKHLCATAASYGLQPPSHFATQFESTPLPHLSTSDKFRLLLADDMLSISVTDLAKWADEVAVESKIKSTDPEEIKRILERYRLGVTAENTRALCDILNAAWEAFEEDSFWSDQSHIGPKKNAVLNELVLKNIELFEIEHIKRAVK